MEIIPVIDLKDGLVVSAQRGQRDLYKPVESTICVDSSIEAVISGFLSIYPFNTFYIADLNAVTNAGSNQYLIDRVIFENPERVFWVDNGKKLQDLSQPDAANYKVILGSECQHELTANETLKNCILSLDYFPDLGYTGPMELIENFVYWPQDIIIMTLDRIGGNSGPDYKKLKSFYRKYPGKNFVAAGGVRNKLDLVNLKKIGIKQVLLASAIHSGVIDSETIRYVSLLN